MVQLVFATLAAPAAVGGLNDAFTNDEEWWKSCGGRLGIRSSVAR
jgi:hypothetical protein